MFGLDGPTAAIVVSIFVAGFVITVVPFILNYRLAKSRGKSVALMMLLTVVFSWIVTLVLAFMPPVESSQT